MIAVRIGPDLRSAVVGAPSYFSGRPKLKAPQDLTEHNWINLRLPTHGGLYAWKFEKCARELRVRVEGQLVTNGSSMLLDAALAGFGLAYLPEAVVQPFLLEGRLIRVLPSGVRPIRVTISTTRTGANPRRPSPSWSRRFATQRVGADPSNGLGDVSIYKCNY